MKVRNCFCVVLSMVFMLLIPMQVIAETDLVEPAEKSSYIVVVSDDDAIKKLNKNYDAEIIEGVDGIFTVELTDYQASRLERKSYVLELEEDVLLTGSEYSGDSADYASQWYLNAIGMTDDELSPDTVKIELLDSGVDYSDNFHPVANINLDSNDLNESVMFVDSTGHATALASVICSVNKSNGLDGINPNAKLYSVKALDCNNQAPLSRIIEGIYWGIDNGMDIINMSFGTTVDSEILHNAVQEAYEAGILMIAAAGNTNHQEIQYPAAYEEVIAVGSINSSGELSEMTSIGTNLDILAPGENIAATDFLDTVSGFSGTSIATAQVTGIASLLWGVDKTKTNDFIKQLICSTANKPDSLTGTEAGIINFNNAINCYDEFNLQYIPNQIISNFDVNNNFDYSDEAEEPIVNALWGYTEGVAGHDELATEATYDANFGGNAPKITRYACTNMDNHNTENINNIVKYVGGPHGSGNYMINLRFLFLISRCIYENGTGSEYEQLISKFEGSTEPNADFWNVSWHTEDSDYDLKRFSAIVRQVRTFIDTKEIMHPDIVNNFNNYSSESQNRYLGLMIFGMALHLVGDIYAHRAIVPKSTVSGTLPTGVPNYYSQVTTKFYSGSFANYNGTASWNNQIATNLYLDQDIDSNYKNLQYFKLAVNRNIVEFRDIKVFLLQRNCYEDNTYFCSNRYSASMLACKRIANRFKVAGSFFTKLVYPKDFNATDTENEIYRTLVLNNFRQYTITANLNDIGANLSETDWSYNSNQTLV